MRPSRPAIAPTGPNVFERIGVSAVHASAATSYAKSLEDAAPEASVPPSTKTTPPILTADASVSATGMGVSAVHSSVAVSYADVRARGRPAPLRPPKTKIVACEFTTSVAAATPLSATGIGVRAPQRSVDGLYRKSDRLGVRPGAVPPIA